MRLRTRQRWWIHLILVTGYCLFIGIHGLQATTAAGLATTHSHPAARLLFGWAIEMTLFATVFALAFFCSRVTPDELLLRWHGNIKPIWQGLAYSIGLRLAIGFLIWILFIVLIVAGIMARYQIMDISAAHNSGVERIVSTPALRSNPAFFWLSITLTSFVFAGLREELWRSAFLAGVKALWPQSFQSRSGKIGAIAFAAVVFGFGHTTQGALAVLQAGLIGFGLGSIMIYHRSIWPAVVAHGMFDATSMILLAAKN
jgi:membrane protease YdiL (CAAX protease family)